MLRAAGKMVAAVVLLPFAFVAALFAGKQESSADEVAEALRNHLGGGHGPWDWDDFTSVPIKDPALESIRSRALALDDPSTDQSLNVVAGLLAEAEGLRVTPPDARPRTS